MHVTRPKNDKHILKFQPLDHTKVRRGHRPHRSGAGLHSDRRLKRLRSRGDQERAALGEG